MIALINKATSGKRLTIRSIDLQNLTTQTGVTAIMALGRVASMAGEYPLAFTPHDSAATAWPSTVKLWAGGEVNTPGIPVARMVIEKQASGAGQLGWLARATPIQSFGAFRDKTSRAGSVDAEAITLREGESAALYMANAGRSQPLRVTATIVRLGTPNRTWTGSWFAQAQNINSSIFAVENQAGSGETIRIEKVSIEEAGTLDSPYFQVVPIGSVNAETGIDPQGVVTITPTDSLSPAASTFVDCLENVAILPFGLPENAFSEASTGTPKGFNYLKSKDFSGPAWRAVFPEMVAHGTGLQDGLGYSMNSHKYADIGFRGAKVVLRPGEGLGIVSAAETAIVGSAVGMSGWSTWHFRIVFDLDPIIEPVLTITGLRNPSEVRIFNAGTSTELAGQEVITSGTFQWTFDPAVYPNVDIAVLSLGYQNIRFANFALTLADTTLPVQQIIDRQYQNI